MLHLDTDDLQKPNTMPGSTPEATNNGEGAPKMVKFEKCSLSLCTNLTRGGLGKAVEAAEFCQTSKNQVSINCLHGILWTP